MSLTVSLTSLREPALMSPLFVSAGTLTTADPIAVCPYFHHNTYILYLYFDLFFEQGYRYYRISYTNTSHGV